MKNFTKLFALAVVILGFSATSFGQVDLSATAKINASAIVTPGTDLNFGSFTQGLGTVVITPAGAQSQTLGVTLLAGTFSAGDFTVGGSNLQVVTITMPAAPVILHTPALGTGAKDMTINVGGFAYDNGGFGQNPCTIGTSGVITVNIGATLQVTASQAIGTYTGSYPVTVALN